MLFCAFCCSHSLLQSGGSLASIITTVSLSLFLSHTHKHPLTLLLSHLLSASYTLLVHLSLPPPPSCIPPSLPLARHHQNIDIFNVLRQLAFEINHSCKSQPCLAIVLHALYVNLYWRRKQSNIKQNIVCNVAIDSINIRKGKPWCASLPYLCRSMSKHAVAILT